MLRIARVFMICLILASSAAAAQADGMGLPGACPMMPPQLMTMAVQHACCVPKDCECEIRMPSRDVAVASATAVARPATVVSVAPNREARLPHSSGTALNEQPASKSPPPKDKLYELFSDPRI